MQLVAGVVASVLVLSVVWFGAATGQTSGACINVYLSTNKTNNITYSSVTLSAGELASVTAQSAGYSGLQKPFQTGWFIYPKYAPGCTNANTPGLTQLVRYSNGIGAHWYTTTALNEKAPAGFTVDNNFQACCFDPTQGFGISNMTSTDYANCGPTPGQGVFVDPVWRYTGISTTKNDFVASTTVNSPIKNVYALLTAAARNTNVAAGGGGAILCYAIAAPQNLQLQY